MRGRTIIEDHAGRELYVNPRIGMILPEGGAFWTYPPEDRFSTVHESIEKNGVRIAGQPDISYTDEYGVTYTYLGTVI